MGVPGRKHGERGSSGSSVREFGWCPTVIEKACFPGSERGAGVPVRSPETPRSQGLNGAEISAPSSLFNGHGTPPNYQFRYWLAQELHDCRSALRDRLSIHQLSWTRRSAPALTPLRWDEINPGSRMRSCRLDFTEPAGVISSGWTARPAGLPMLRKTGSAFTNPRDLFRANR